MKIKKNLLNEVIIKESVEELSKREGGKYSGMIQTKNCPVGK